MEDFHRYLRGGPPARPPRLTPVVPLSRKALPLERRFCLRTHGTPLPRKQFRSVRRRSADLEKLPYSPELAIYRGRLPQVTELDFSERMYALCCWITSLCPEFRHIQMDRVIVGATQARQRSRGGLLARVTPLRFHSGRLYCRRRGKLFQIQRYWLDDVEMLYVVDFCLPRFLDQTFEQKFVTIFHELYHISPAFDGDIRRHEGRYNVHTHSKKEYDAYMAVLAKAFLEHPSMDPVAYEFLRLNFRQLEEAHRTIVAVSVPSPRMIPVAWRPAREEF